MPHASAVNPDEMDASEGDRASTDEPPAARIEVRTAPGLAQPVQVNWIAEHLERAAALIAQRESAAIARLNVLIVDDARMIALHESHSGDATTTDVLTFDLRTDKTQPVEADIVICADEAASRAAQLQHTIEQELLLYCVHGVLHCLGYDDHDEHSWQRMHALEDEILTAIGVGPTFRTEDHHP
jgi:probable rRNA maturation factor